MELGLDLDLDLELELGSLRDSWGRFYPAKDRNHW